jgi:hypothetical protein
MCVPNLCRSALSIGCDRGHPLRRGNIFYSYKLRKKNWNKFALATQEIDSTKDGQKFFLKILLRFIFSTIFCYEQPITTSHFNDLWAVVRAR